MFKNSVLKKMTLYLKSVRTEKQLRISSFQICIAYTPPCQYEKILLRHKPPRWVNMQIFHIFKVAKIFLKRPKYSPQLITYYQKVSDFQLSTSQILSRLKKRAFCTFDILYLENQGVPEAAGPLDIIFRAYSFILTQKPKI